MSHGQWTRRDFVKVASLAAVPALVAMPTLAQETRASALVAAPSSGDPELWAEAGKTIDFYRKHLPANLRLGTLTNLVGDDDPARVQTVSIPIVEGVSEVGFLALNATFQPDGSRTLLWQSTKVAGNWYPASIASAFKAEATLEDPAKV